LSGECEVLVIGGGLIGASIAWRLGCAGAGVTLLEAGRLGGEASWAGAGMLIPGSEFETAGGWRDFAFHSLQLYPGFVSKLERESQVQLDFSVCGSLELAGSEQDWEQLRAQAARQASRGQRNELLSAREVQSLMPLLRPDLEGGVFYPEDAQADPRTLMAALEKACLGRGVILRERCPVKRIRLKATGIEAETAAGWFKATRAVLAAGAWSTGIEMTAPDRLQPLPDCFPVRGHLLGYRLKPGSLPHIVRYGHTYLVQRRTGFTIAGTSEERVGLDRSLDAPVCADIAGRARALAPGLIPELHEEAWTGFRPGIDQPGPAVGRWGDTPLWLAYGHFRNGILLAPATAERIADGISASLERG